MIECIIAGAYIVGQVMTGPNQIETYYLDEDRTVTVVQVTTFADESLDKHLN